MTPLKLNAFAHQERLDRKKFELAIRKLADSLNYGSDPSIFLGSGIDYAQSRPYQEGDSVKSIDWKITARTQRYHVKTYEAPKMMNFYFLLDTSASFCLSTQSLSKYALALHIATALGSIAQQRLSAVGVMSIGEQKTNLNPTLSQQALLHTAFRLQTYNLGEKTLFLQSANELLSLLHERAVVIVLSDFQDPQALNALRRIATQHDTVAIHLSDPAERPQKQFAFIRAQSAETDQFQTLYSGENRFNFSEIEKQMMTSQIDYIHLFTDRPFIPALRYFLQNRNLFGRRHK